MAKIDEGRTGATSGAEEDSATLPVIAVDGTAASGKGSLARSLATKLGFAYLDTGVLYRLIAIRMMENGCGADDERSALEFARLLRRTADHRNITPAALKTDQVSVMTSRIATFAAVRAELLELQRAFASGPPPLADGTSAQGTVLDGRDIGTIVCPQAALKFFVTADIETRAFRRFREMQMRGFLGSYQAVLAEIGERDARDAGRTTAPMKAAEDAVIIDTTKLSPAEVLNAALWHVENKLRPTTR